MKTRENIIHDAEVWAKTVWNEALLRWSVRSGQDKSYRWHVIYPAIVNILSESFQNKRLRILDLGCGDGIFLDNQNTSELIANDGAYLGVDISGELIEKARDRHNENNVGFLVGNLSDTDFARRILNRETGWDCVLSVFVIQEIPDIESFMENLERILKTGAFALIVTVHPDFALWLKQTGRMRITGDHANFHEQESPPWRWAGYYPIVDEPNEAFFLPYFHRTTEDYRSLMERFGIIVEKIIELPDKNDLPLLMKQGFSPFTPFEHNIYWPRICEVPSALFIIARKE